MRKAALSIGIINVLFIAYAVISISFNSGSGIPYFPLLVILSFAAGIVGIVLAAATRKESPVRLGNLVLVLNISIIVLYVAVPALLFAFIIGAMFIPTGA